MEYLNNVLNSITYQFGQFLPGVVGAILILFIGLILAKYSKDLVKRLMKRTSLDDKLEGKMKIKFKLGDFLASLVYSIMVVYTLLIVLNLLGVQDVLVPLQEMLTEFLGFLPRIVAASVIVYAGYIISSLAADATGFISSSIEEFSTNNKIKNGRYQYCQNRQTTCFYLFVHSYSNH